MTTKEILDYLHVQFPATVGHVPLKPMLERMALDYMKEGAQRAGDMAEDYDGDSRHRHGNDLTTKQNIASEIRAAAKLWTEADL